MTRSRVAYTLMELLVASASASVLVAGLSSALFIAAQSMDIDGGKSAQRARADLALERIVSDAQTATRFRELGSKAIEFDVADRDGDQIEETLRYEWSGTAGDPLTRTLNGGSAVNVLRDVQSLYFGWDQRTDATPEVDEEPPTSWPLLETGEVPTVVISDQQISLSAPTRVVPGDLLLAAVATDKDTSGTMKPPPDGWHELTLVGVPDPVTQDGVTLGVWAHTVSAGDAPTHTWTWSGNETAMGWIIAIHNTDPTEPYNSVGIACDTGFSSTPVAPTATASADNSLVLRIVTADGDFIAEEDVSGLTGYREVWSRNSGNFLSMACGYKNAFPVGDVGTAMFALNGSDDYVTSTVVIRPKTLVGE